jgi:hypothetical protein
MPEEGEEAMGEDHPRKKLLHRRLGDVETFLIHKKKLEDEVCLLFLCRIGRTARTVSC